MSTRAQVGSTLALRGLPLLARLDGLRLANWQLVAALICGGAVIGGLVSIALALWIPPGSELGSINDPGYLGFNGALSGLFLALAVIITRALQQGLSRDMAQDLRAAEHLHGLTVSVPKRRWALLAAVLYASQAWPRRHAGVELTRI